jgi:hypothetical protein
MRKSWSMETVAQLPIAHPALRTAAIGAHVALAGWLLLNGVGHQAHVLWKNYRGTLRADHDLSSLLLVGAGLLVAGAVVSWSVAPLSRAAGASTLPAFLGTGLLALVLAAIARAYGTTFLGGTITLGLIDLALLGTHAALNART